MLEKSDATWVQPPQWLIDRWNSEGEYWYKTLGVYYANLKPFYNKDTGYFEGHGLKDLTTNDVMNILNVSQRILEGNTTSDSLYMGLSRVRTLMPLYKHDYGGGFSLKNMFNRCMELETVVISDYYKLSQDKPLWITITENAFKECNKLRCVYGYLGLVLSQDTTSHFNNIGSNEGPNQLRDIKLNGVKLNIPLLFKNSPFVSFETFKYLIDNAKNTTPISITVHSNVYSALLGEADYPFNGGSREEWEQLLLDAISKDITFTKP